MQPMFKWTFLSLVFWTFEVLAQDCGLPGSISFGSFAGSTLFGKDAAIVCWNGFTGGGNAICSVAGSWDPFPECSPIDCGSVTIPNGNLSGDTFYNGSAVVICSTGYQGGGLAFCLSSGMWDTLPTCTPKDCGEPKIPNGGLSATSDTVFDGSSTVVCDPGYEVLGSDVATCSQDGTWDTLPTCNPKDCGPPPIPHGYLTTAGSTLYGKTAEIMCDAGYLGYGFATCLTSGSWDNDTLPTCTPIDCGMPFILHGGLTTESDTFYEGIANVVCDPGYEIGGLATCLDTGKWDTLPTCDPVDCGNPGDPNGFLSGDSFFAGTASIICNTGYTGGGPITCLDNGNWSTSTANTCVLVDCGGPNDPNGVLIGSSLYSGTASITCNTGYVGGGSIKCLASGNWDKTLASKCVLADCGPLIAPTNGGIDVTKTTYNSSASFSCGHLYQMRGNAVLTCQADGSWSFPPPTCENIDCQLLMAPTDGYLSTTGVTVGTLTYVLCNTGYSLFGLSPLACETGGTWNDVVGVCKKDCPELTRPTYGTLSTTEVKEGTTVKVKCNKGYTMFGDSILECLPGATWNTTVPDCVRECGSLVNPNDGEVSHPDGTTLNNNAIYTCNTGYYPSHTNSRVCQADGTWSNTPVICVIHDCGHVLPPKNGSVVYPTGTTYDQTLAYSCDIGYNLVGDSNRTCQADGTWDLTDPYCQIRDCGPLASPISGSVDNSEGTTYLSVAIFSCNLGYTMDGSATSTCQASAQWSNEAPVCNINDCGPLSDPSDGFVAYPATTYSQNATYTCVPGYFVDGVKTRMCQANSSWSESAPYCTIKDCGLLDVPTNGSVTYSNSATTYEEVATFSCDPGFSLVGPLKRTCNDDGLWGDSSPICQIKDCGNLTSPVYGFVEISAGTTYTEVADYSCDPGYNLIGDTQRTCLSNGQWSGSAATCQIKDCGYLTNPTNGLVSVLLTTFGEVANYFCNPGYYVIGAQTRTCQANGTWSSSAPGCSRKDCGEPPEIDNGYFTIPVGTKFGDITIYSCYEYYGLVGSAAVACLDTGKWSTVPVCSQDCGTPLAIDNGIFAPPSDTLMGAIVTYTCTDGYEMVRSENVTCQAGGTWSQAPGCKLVPIIYNDECLVTAQCVTKKATCRSNAGIARCLCSSSQIYDASVDSCLADCGPLPSPTDGSVALPPVTSEGQIVVYSCDLNFALSDLKLAIRTCLSTGLWSGSAPLCISGCQSPVPPKNGYVNATQGYVAGHRVYYTCASGYTLVGEEERTCLSESYLNGDEYTLWSGNDPVCSIECPLLSGISHGNVDLSRGYWQGSVATYVCENNYALIGDAIRKCLATGQWKGVEPICVIAIFPDILMAIGGVMMFLVIVDILGILFCVYQQFLKKKDKSPKYSELSDDRAELLNTEDDANSHTGASLIRKHEGANPDDLAGTPRILQARSTLPRPPRLDESQENYEDERFPFEPPYTIQRNGNLLNATQMQETDFDSFLQREFQSQDNGEDPNQKPITEEDQISVDYVTNPVLEEKFNLKNHRARKNKRPMTKIEDASVLFKGRMSLPKGPDGIKPKEGEPLYTEEARRYLKESMETYSPINPNQAPAKS